MEIIHIFLVYLIPDVITTVVCKEYCQAQMFQPKCNYNEVILMTRALYGRMEEGKCNIKGKFVMGCHNDVIDVMDQLCSGKKECSVQIPHEALLKRNTCSDELVAYLEADYQCVHAYKCQSSLVRITNDPGYLMASGQAGCGFQLEVKKGQQIELSSIHLPARRNVVCLRVEVTEHLAANQMSKDFDHELCSNGERYHHFYTSTAHHVTLHLHPPVSNQQPVYNNSHVLVHYKAVGCANPEVPEGHVVTRDGDMVNVQCNTSYQAWNLVCRDTEWVGEIGQCLGEHSMPTSPQKSFFQLKNGVVLAVLIGVALGVLVGVLLLATYITISKMGKRKYDTPREYIYPEQPNPRKACDIEEVGYHLQRTPTDNPTTATPVDTHNAHIHVETFAKSPAVTKCGVHVQLRRHLGYTGTAVK